MKISTPFNSDEGHTVADQQWLGAQVPSLLKYAWEEIQRHKWLESEKARRDLGDVAIADWVGRYWWRFCRWRRIEHVEGVQRWFEFPLDDFAKVLRPILENDRLMLVVVEMMKSDRLRVMNDLEIIVWARDTGLPMDRILQILRDIHINTARLDPPNEWCRHWNNVRAIRTMPS